MRKLSIAFLLIMGALALSCSKDFSLPSPPAQEHEWRPLEKEVLSASSRFGITLFKEIAKAEPGKNVFISPFSVSAALGMTLNGAAGQTETDMRNVLGFAGMEKADINRAYQNLLSWLAQADPKVALEIAQSIWYRLGFPVETSFIETNRTCFDALVRGLDFTIPSAKDTINGWIEKNTNGKIQQMISLIKPTDIMFLVNAVYFKGIWKIQFDKSQTQEGTFTRSDGSPITCPMMRQKDSLMYASDEGVQAVDLAYGDGAFSMLILLPKTDTSVDAFIRGLTPEKWSGWTDALRKTGVSLIMPKYKTLYDVTLNDALKAMGMGTAFSPDEADFTRIHRGGNLFIDRVLHKAFVEVNEEGTEAAAATVVVIGRTSIGGPEEIFMIINRPFIFAIRERQSGAILFMGKIEDPS
jgi:serine protease inhibitor